MDKSLFDMDKVLDDFEFHEAHQSFMQTPGNTTNSSVGTEGSVAPQEYSANIFQSSDMSLTTGIPSLNRWTEVSDQSFWENGRGQEMPKTITKPSVSSEIPDIIRETTRCSKEIVAAKDMPAASERNGTFSSMDKENQHESTLLSFDEAPKVSSREVYLNEDLDNNAAEAVEDVKGVPVHDLVDSHVEEQKVEIDNGAAGDAVEPAIAEEATEKTVISSDSSSDSNVVHMDVMSGEMTVSHEKPEHAALKFGDLPVDLSEEDLNRELELLEEEEEYVAPTPPVSGVLSENVDLQSMGDEKDVSDGIDSRSPSTQEENLGTKNSSEEASAPGQEVPSAPMPPQSLPPSLNPPVNEQAPPQPLPKKETPPAGVVPVGIGLDFGSSSVDSHPKFKIGSSPPTSSSSEMDSELSTPSEETSSAVPPPRPPYAPMPKHLPPLPPSSVSRHQGRPPQSSIAAKHRPSSPSSISRLQPPPPPSPPISRHLPSPPPLDADPVAMSFDEEVDALERDLNATSLSLVPAVSSTPRPLSLPLSSAAPQANQDAEHQDSTSNPGPGGVGQSVAAEPADVGSPPPVPVMEENADVSRVSLRDGLGTVAPKWIPDSEATNCMLCDARFTFTRRRHHCRCCGILVCASCSSQKVKLPYLEGKEGRVCQPCYDLLTEDDSGSAVTSPSSAAIASGIPSAPVACAPSVSTPPAGAGSAAASSVLPPNHSPLLPRNRPPNPNNPEEYCSTIPPFQQATAHAPPPTVMVPVGVLKRSGAGSTTPNGPKSVMFSDGIRPGGDLTELDRPWPSRPRGSQRGGPNRRQDSRAGRSGASSSRSNKGTTSPSSSSSAPRLNVVPGGMLSSISLIPIGDGLPPLARVTSDGRLALRECPLDYMFSLQGGSNEPLCFAVTRNLRVFVDVLRLSCCVNRECWIFSTEGMRTVAQDEILIVLERQTEEVELPRDILLHLNEIYQAAAKGDTYGPLSHSVATGMFLGSRDHAGFLFVRPTFQCLDGGMLLPSSPFLIGILLTKWEMPWAKVFPLRLMLRLGAEFRFYPCPLFSVRNRKPVYMEVGHTIMNLLADFRNFSYTLATVPGAKIQMEDRITSLLLPRSSYNQVMKAVSSSDEHALAFAATFSREADSHLVCTQSAEDFSYQTQAINIQNKPRKVTGASFIVFNGSLKHSSGLSGKSSIVEDGLMVHIPQETMALLRSALESCSDFEIGCGTMGEMNLDDTVQIRWIQENEDLNDGVLSPVDNRSMKGVKSVAIHKGTDYLGDSKLIRWTELFLIQVTDADSSSQRDLVDVNRLSEAVARAACLALVKHLDPLMAAGKSRLGFRAIIDMENVSYECGSRGERLPSSVLNDLDTEVIPVIHRAATALESVGGVGLVLELVFHILFCGDIEDVDKPEEVVPREAGSSLHSD